MSDAPPAREPVGPSALQRDAEAIAEAAMRAKYAPSPVPAIASEMLTTAAERQRIAMSAYAALLERYMTALVDAGHAAQEQRNGRELAIFERDFEKIAALVAALVAGNYLDTACRLSDIAYSGVRAWLKAADDGDERYETVGRLIRAAESIAEAEAVMLVRSAGTDPRFWAAPATWLERKFPQKYGRRQEDNDTPRVLVQIGVKDGDVQVQLGLSPRLQSSTEAVGGRASTSPG